MGYSYWNYFSWGALLHTLEEKQHLQYNSNLSIAVSRKKGPASHQHGGVSVSLHVALLVEQYLMNHRVTASPPVPSWPHVELSFNKTPGQHSVLPSNFISISVQ